MKFYAHSVEQRPKSEWQGLADHLISVGEMAAEFASVFGAEGRANAAGKHHDLWKYKS